MTSAACAGPCTANGKNGQCKATAFPNGPTQFPVWYLDKTVNPPKWKPSGGFMQQQAGAPYSLVTCGCAIPDGAGGQVGIISGCCDVAAVQGVWYSAPRVVKVGACDIPNCDPTNPFCSVTGDTQGTRAWAICKD